VAYTEFGCHSTVSSGKMQQIQQRSRQTIPTHLDMLSTSIHNCNIKRDVQPELPIKTLSPPQPSTSLQNGEGSPMAAAMNNLRAIANDCCTTSVHITMERLYRLLYNYMQDADFNTCRDAAPVLSKPQPAIPNNRQRHQRAPRQPSNYSIHNGPYAPY
jgi:hypothetical protein